MRMIGDATEENSWIRSDVFPLFKKNHDLSDSVGVGPWIKDRKTLFYN